MVKERPEHPDDRSRLRRPVLPSRSRTLWCGKVQGLCDGSLCVDCHLFPGREDRMSVEANSTIDTPTLTDHEKVGLTADED
ncbi:MAG: hypothetical protein ACMUHU_01180 [Thermoplasmatota archaeon]